MSDEATTSPAMEAKPNGPYIVTGATPPPLRRTSPVMSEHGEPMTWKTGDAVETGAVYALCRCGGSENKPFCDGTHVRNGFDGTETATTESRAETSTSLGGERIEIFDDRKICAHAGFCGNEATNIWKMAEQTGDSRIRANAIAMVEHCPSGAITYSIDDEEIEPNLPAEIGLIENGPIWVTGAVSVTRSDGETIEPRNRVTLCRCGQSKNKPFCDGAHYDAGFEG